jgi:hypothetical protein
MKEFTSFLLLYKQNPIDLFSNLLNQVKYKYLYLILAMFGLCLACNTVIDKLYLASGPLALDTIIYPVLGAFLFTFIYSWIVAFINGLLNGHSNQKDVFAVIVYALIPLIFGSIILLLLKILFYTLITSKNLYFNIYNELAFISIIFYCWSIVYLIIGNAIINDFSVIKSALTSAVVPLMTVVSMIIKIVKIIH